MCTAGADPENFCRLDDRVVGLWRVERLIAWAFLVIPAVVGGIIFLLAKDQGEVWVYSGWCLLIVLCVWRALIHPARLYRTWGYRLDERVLEIRSGIWFKIVQLLPLNRLQHVDIQRGPLERAFGLSTLLLHTAGTQQATLVIPGLEQAEAIRLRDQLVTIGGDDAV